MCVLYCCTYCPQYDPRDRPSATELLQHPFVSGPDVPRSRGGAGDSGL